MVTIAELNSMRTGKLVLPWAHPPLISRLFVACGRLRVFQVEGFQAHETSCTVLFGGADKYATPSQEDICKDLEGTDDKVQSRPFKV
jgi:hypothetical protein